MPNNRERAVSISREFVRQLSVEPLSANASRVRSVKGIHELLTTALGGDVSISKNLLEKVRSGEPGPGEQRKQWDPVMDAIIKLEIDDSSRLSSLQKEIRRHHCAVDDPSTKLIEELFAREDYSPDFPDFLYGEYVVYRQITNSELVAKALLTIDEIGGRAIRFQFIRADSGLNRGRYSEGRVIDSFYGYTLIGSIHTADGLHDTGLMMASIAKMRGMDAVKNMNFATGVHCLVSDFTDPCASKMVLVRSNNEKSLKDFDGFSNAQVRQDKLDVFSELEGETGKLLFEDAIEEICSISGLDEDVIENALSNETSRSDTLHFDSAL